MNKRISVKCKKCGNTWSPLAKNLIKHGCAVCSKDKKRKTRLSHKEFVQIVAENNKDVMIVSQYQGSHKPVTCKCLKCGNEWSATAYNIMKGHGCRKCFGKRHSVEMKKQYAEGKLGINKKPL